MSELQDQAVRQHCKTLRMPTIGGQFARLAEAAGREGQSHVGYLEALLAAEMEERESRARGVEAKHGADLTGAKPGDELLEARARHGAAGGATEIIVDDLDIAKSVAARFINEVILARWLSRWTCTWVCVDWRTYTTALRLRTVGGRGSAFVIADLLGIRAGGFHQQTGQTPNGGVALGARHSLQYGTVQRSRRPEATAIA